MSVTPTQPLLRSFLTDCGWSPTTKQSARDVFKRWVAWLDGDLTAATRADCEAYLAELAGRGLAPATVHVHWRMLRALYRWLYAEDEIDSDPMRRIAGPRVTETPVKVLTDAEYRRLVSTCDRRSTIGRRDEAILSLLWWSGLRRAEVVGLDLDGLDDTDGGWLAVGSRSFSTKTGKTRRVPLAAETRAAIDRYLRRRGEDPGPLFLSNKGDAHDDRRLRPNSIQLMLRKRAQMAGLGRSVGAHEFRRAMAVRHKRLGGSDPALMAIAGWSGIRMVDRYTRMEREDLAGEEFRRLIDTSQASTRRRGGRRLPRRAG